MKTYEAMFVMDPSLASDWPSAEAEINRFLQRADAKVLGLKNWEDRRLAYPIRRQKRGLYALSYFQSSPDKIAGLERDAQLSEKVLRVLILAKDKMTPEQIEKSLAAAPPKIPTRSEEGWRGGPGGGGFGERGGYGGDRDDRGRGPRRTDEGGGQGDFEADIPANIDVDEE